MPKSENPTDFGQFWAQFDHKLTKGKKSHKKSKKAVNLASAGHEEKDLPKINDSLEEEEDAEKKANEQGSKTNFAEEEGSDDDSAEEQTEEKPSKENTQNASQKNEKKKDEPKKNEGQQNKSAKK